MFVATCTKIYQFISPESPFNQVFKLYESGNTNFQEIPGDQTTTQLYFSYNESSKLPKTFSWKTNSGVYLATLNFASQSQFDSIISTAQLFPFTDSQIPISITPTRFHLISLFNSFVSATRILDHELVYSQNIQVDGDELVNGLVLGNNTYWIWTSRDIYEIVIVNEDADLWQVYLSRRMFDDALTHATVSRNNLGIR